jgi:RimJ/RimL family protein N-acetyltransferase
MALPRDPEQDVRPGADLFALRLNCPVVDTGRLVLRPPHVNDADDIVRLADNPRVATMLGSMPHPYTAADAQAFLKKAEDGGDLGCVYAVTRAGSGEFMGVCGLHEDPARFELPFIGYWLGEPYWGRGYATEAARAMTGLFFKVTDRPQLMITCRTDNIASRRVIEKCGGVYWKSGESLNKVLNVLHQVDHFRVTLESWMAVADTAPATTRQARRANGR